MSLPVCACRFPCSAPKNPCSGRTSSLFLSVGNSDPKPHNIRGLGDPIFADSSPNRRIFPVHSLFNRENRPRRVRSSLGAPPDSLPSRERRSCGSTAYVTGIYRAGCDLLRRAVRRRGARQRLERVRSLDGRPARVAPSALGRGVAQLAPLRPVNRHEFGGEPRPSASWDGAGPCAVQTREPRQTRKGAALSGHLQVPQDHPAFVSFAA